MSYQFRIMRDRPYVAIPLNPGETTTFADVSGNGYTATAVGTLTEYPPLAAGGGSSRRVNQANYFNFIASGTPDYTNKYEYAYEIWFKPVVNGAIQVLGHAADSDGIEWDGEAITFTTVHGSAGTCQVVYYPPFFSPSFHVVGQHTFAKNELWVNGVLVGSTNLTDAQQLAGTQESTKQLTVGKTTGTASILVDSPAVYTYVLSESQITSHHLWGRFARPFASVVSDNGGVYWSFTDSDVFVGYEKTYTGDTWAEGSSTGLSYQSGTLLPLFDENNTTLSASWVEGLLLGAVSDTINGSKIEWDGDGDFTVQSSINGGATWSTCVNGREIPGISSGFSTTNKVLSIQITFPAGEDEDTITKVRSLTFKLYTTRNPISSSPSRSTTLFGNATLADTVHEPLEYFDNSGLSLYGGYAILGKDTDPTPDPTRTVEAWVKFDSIPASQSYFFDVRDTGSDTLVAVSMSSSGVLTANGGTIYVNGAAYAGQALSVGRWYHIVFVLSSNNTKNIFLGSNVAGSSLSLAHYLMVASYPTALSSTDVSVIYSAYLGAPQIKVIDGSTIKVSDDVPSTLVYNYVWSQNAG